MRRAAPHSAGALETMTREHLSLRFGLDALYVTGGRPAGVLWEIVENVYTTYSRLIPMKVTRHPKTLNSVMADRPIRAVYIGGYGIRVGMNGYS